MENKGLKDSDPFITKLFKVGAHFGYSKSRRHPTSSSYIFGVKNRVEIFDLEKTKTALNIAKEFVKNLASGGRQIIFVGGKNEAREAIKNGASEIAMPYVAGRWLGGTISNFSQIKSRADRFIDLKAKREKGELVKYTKKEQLLFGREIDKLDRFFSGLVPLTGLPGAIFVIDSKHEKIAVSEARRAGIPVVALLSSDCNVKEIDYPIPGNDSSMASIGFFVKEIVSAYKEGKALVAKEVKKETVTA